jgi:hypothetical protein
MRSTGQTLPDVTREHAAQQTEMAAENHEIAGARERETHP